jgi:hypothetical protein
VVKLRKILVLAATVGILAVATTQAEAINIRRCSFQGLDNGTWTTREVKRTITCTANRFQVSVEKALYIANRESGYNEWAYNDGGCGGWDCGGVFQHHMLYWAGRADMFPDWQRWWRINSDCWCNPRIQALVTIKMVQRGGWGPWGG